MEDKEFVKYPEALELKQLGFQARCFGYYWENLFYFKTTSYHPSTMPNSPESCLAPTYSQAFRWFREKGYENWIPHNEEGYQFVIEWEFKHTGGREVLRKINSHEEAELACLRKMIEIAKAS